MRNVFRTTLQLFVFIFNGAVFNDAIVMAETAATVAIKAQAAIDNGNPPKWWTLDLPEDVRRDIDNKAKRLTDRLEIKDEETAQKTETAIRQHFSRLWAWHQQVDERLNAAWAAWDAARDNRDGKQKDELKALTIMTERIDPIYAEFAPQIRLFLTSLHEVIGESKTTELLDHITRSPGAKRTFDAYVEMVPEMTDAEKDILWRRMVQAREDSLAAWTDGQIVKIFKKYKVRNEHSLDDFGYGYQKRYQAWVKSKRS
jgi:hypothetical protein